ncbi:MAG: hypothetical protein L6R41_007231 [Letrouitia leprolyta]|nr:MAG: hypothetical protein L6R41_007231 [Letrouitia leprolyta]
MPVITRHQHILSDTNRSSTDSSAQEYTWVVHEDYEKPQKEMDFPSAGLHNKMARHGFKINTYSKSDLHDRYMSSEEEPSPSPDSSDAESTRSEELKHKSSARILATEEAVNDLSSNETEAEADATIEIAVAMPIVAYNRPRLIDITNLAPMQKRRRAIKQPIAPSSKQSMIRTPVPTKTVQNKPSIPNESTEASVPLEKAAEIARKQITVVTNKRLKEERVKRALTPVSSAPDSWLPVEEEPTPSTDDGREYHFPSDERDFEPYSPQTSTARQQYSGPTTRKRNNSNPFTIVNNTSIGKGLNRTWSFAKKGVVHHASISSLSSSSAASYIPPQQQQATFQQTTYQPERQISKKPKMIARGANEREESLVLPPCPFDIAA